MVEITLTCVADPSAPHQFTQTFDDPDSTVNWIRINAALAVKEPRCQDHLEPYRYGCDYE